MTQTPRPLSSSSESIPPPLQSYFREPQIKWGELAVYPGVEKEETYQNVRLGIGSLGLLSLIGAKAVPLKRPLFTVGLPLAAGAMAVAGFALWYWNWDGDKQKLLTARKTVQKEIQKTPLKKIRETHASQRVISNQELNEWARYLLETQKFSDFMKVQGLSILEINLEPDTQKLLKKKYLSYVKSPSNPLNLNAFPRLLELFAPNDLERIALEQTRTQKEGELKTVALESYGAHYERFVRLNGTAGLQGLKSDLLPLYSWLFMISVFKQGIGIIGLEDKHSEDLKIFKQYIDPFVYEYICDRDAETLSFEKFYERNGPKAIGYISSGSIKKSFYLKFKDHALQSDFGWVKAKTTFASVIEAFGPVLTEDLKEAIIKQEWERLETRPYTEFRERIEFSFLQQRFGSRTLKSQEDERIFLKLKELFLNLPPTDLLDDKYKDDRALLQIERADIEFRLRKRWGSMRLIDILKSDKTVFLKCLSNTPPLLDPAQWQAEAANVVYELPVVDILKDYGGFYDANILTAASSNSSIKLGKLPVDVLTRLSSDYGLLIFKHRLMDFQHTKIVFIIASFIADHAEDYLKRSSAPIEPLAQLIADYRLMPEACSRVINQARQDKEAELQKHRDEQGKIEEEFLKVEQAKNTTEDEEIRAASNEVARLRSKFEQAQKAEQLAAEQVANFDRQLQNISREKAQATADVSASAIKFRPLQEKYTKLKETELEIASKNQSLQEEQQGYEAKVAEYKKTKMEEDREYLRLDKERVVEKGELEKVETSLRTIKDIIQERDRFKALVEQERALHSPNQAPEVPLRESENQQKLRTYESVLTIKANSPNNLIPLGQRQQELQDSIRLKEARQADILKKVYESDSVKHRARNVESIKSQIGILEIRKSRLEIESSDYETTKKRLEEQQELERNLESSIQQKNTNKQELTLEFSTKEEERKGAETAVTSAEKNLPHEKERIRKRTKEARENLGEEKAEKLSLETKRHESELQRIKREASTKLHEAVPKKPSD